MCCCGGCKISSDITITACRRGSRRNTSTGGPTIRYLNITSMSTINKSRSSSIITRKIIRTRSGCNTTNARGRRKNRNRGINRNRNRSSRNTKNTIRINIITRCRTNCTSSKNMH